LSCRRLEEICGEEADQLAEIASGWGENFSLAARILIVQIGEIPQLKKALAALIEHFDAVQVFLKLYIEHRVPDKDQGSVNIDQIKAAIVNIGGITDIRSLKIYIVPTEPWLSGKRRYVTGLVVTILLFSALLVIYQSTLAKPPIIPMSGDINIAVAEIQEKNAQGKMIHTKDASTFSESIYDVLKEQISQLEART
jgi:hypothetical protein